MHDMLKATKLTAAGRLTEATALLLGRLAGAAPARAATPSAPAGDTIEMTPPADGGASWTATAKSHVPDAPRDPLRGLKGKLAGLTKPFSRPSQAPPPAEGRFEARVYADAAGQRAYKLYVPGSYEGRPLPLVVMLHGCAQSPDDFAAGTGMNRLAEERGFLVAYPAQPASANAQKCWNWFNGADQRRDSGEPALIAGITRQIMRDYAIDARRVFVAGLSAGGAAAAIMGAMYPDLYAAIGVHSGLACGAARDMPSAFAAMRHGAAAAAMVRGDASGRPVRTIVFHGDRDQTVSPLNGDQVFAQFSAASGPLTSAITRGKAPGGQAYSRTTQTDPDGTTLFEQWVIHGAGHAWSGGSAAGSYTDPRGPDASSEMLRFFGLPGALGADG